MTSSAVSWSCSACTLFNSLENERCGACGASRLRSCSVCTFDNALTALVCEMCGAAFPSSMEGEESSELSAIVDSVTRPLSFEAPSMKRRQIFPTPFEFNEKSDSSQRPPDKEHEFEGEEEETEDSDDQLEDTQSEDSYNAESGLEEEGNDEISLSLPPPPPSSSSLPGLVELSATYPTISQHFWSVKHLESMQACSIRFTDFTLDQPEQKRAKSVDYDKRRKSREAKEKSKAEKRSKAAKSRYAKYRSKAKAKKR
eukprot:scaffold2312_cov165-Ochromonas_danica.AAC.39